MLIGERVSLAPLLVGDRMLLMGWLNDPALMSLSGQFRPMDEVKFGQWFSNAGADKAKVIFGIRENPQSRLVGCLEILDIHATHRSANIGIIIGAEADRGKGLGREALQLAIRYCWDHLNLQRLSLSVAGNNPRAVSAYRRAGFEREGTLRRAAYVGGDFRDIDLMGLLRPGVA